MGDVDPLGASELDAMWPAIMAFSAEVVHRLGDEHLRRVTAVADERDLPALRRRAEEPAAEG